MNGRLGSMIRSVVFLQVTDTVVVTGALECRVLSPNVCRQPLSRKITIENWIQVTQFRTSDVSAVQFLHFEAVNITINKGL